MDRITRRGYLKLVTLVSGFVALPKVVVYGSESALPESAALDFVRDVNSAQAAYRRQFHKYAAMDELVTSPKYKNSSPKLVPAGYSAALRVSGDGLKYRLVVRNNASAFMYHSDQKGVIYEGTATPSMTADVVGGADLRPIVRPSQRTGPQSLFSSLLGFIVPTLHAEHSCLCGSCLGPGECGGPGNVCGLTCCNQGYEDCTWCCGACTC